MKVPTENVSRVKIETSIFKPQLQNRYPVFLSRV